ncbi:SLATT domain-containing protein [Photobacterium damselae subsp. damselae]|uniref:SLATT domain-containing protein n=1 Tax=Photobacterium damselae TaxID=38293 RepID=UPI0010FD9D91|nr:SLATT domain-containing protein [Photobacterium damselae]TLS83837.1 SLATT domain-containing protein [Photobacterium damselae subsp. damselae]TLS91029.1 SLATT domain-containing protein [Photobacterium damselae subsp. damselae]
MFDANSFKKRMKTTAYAKFDAHKRYDRLNNTSLFALTSASSLLIFITLFNKYVFVKCTGINQSFIELFSIVVSIMILVLSLVVSFASYSLKSERYLKTGNDILELCDKLDLASTDFEKKNISQSYNFLRKNADNHKGFNYTRGRLERKKEEGKSDIKLEDKESYIEKYEYWAPIVSFYAISILSILIFLIMISICVIYA